LYQNRFVDCVRILALLAYDLYLCTIHISIIDSNDAPVFKSSKIRRELWSAEDTNSFFEGLNEFGKDFESIQWFMVNRAKRKGSCEQAIKSKEQLRHFYYRTWHKICKYIEFPKGND